MNLNDICYFLCQAIFAIFTKSAAPGKYSAALQLFWPFVSGTVAKWLKWVHSLGFYRLSVLSLPVWGLPNRSSCHRFEIEATVHQVGRPSWPSISQNQHPDLGKTNESQLSQLDLGLQYMISIQDIDTNSFKKQCQWSSKSWPRWQPAPAPYTTRSWFSLWNHTIRWPPQRICVASGSTARKV